MPRFPSAHSSSPLLSVRSLTKRYGSTLALDGFDCEVRPGEILGLLGPNGAGKTTAVECILGLRRPDAGTIRVGGHDARAEPDRVKPLLGAQLQSTRLPEKLTPREALGLFGAFHAESEAPESLLTRFGLTDKADAPYDTLSGGQRQRLALALAFVGRPRLLVLDEPTVGLDPAVRRELLDAVVAFRDAGGAVLLCTHQLDEAEKHCDRLILLDRGKGVAAGTPAELVAATRQPTRIRFSALRDPDFEALGRLPSIGSIGRRGEAWTIETTQPSRALVDLTAHLRDSGNDLRSLHIEPPSLEAAFLQLSGRPWPEAPTATEEPA